MRVLARAQPQTRGGGMRLAYIGARDLPYSIVVVDRKLRFRTRTRTESPAPPRSLTSVWLHPVSSILSCTGSQPGTHGRCNKCRLRPVLMKRAKLRARRCGRSQPTYAEAVERGTALRRERAFPSHRLQQPRCWLHRFTWRTVRAASRSLSLIHI